MIKRLRKLFGFLEDKVVTINTDVKANEKYANVISNYQDAITKSGARSIKVSTLLNHFGYKKMGSRNLINIEAILEQSNLYCFPSISSKVSRDTRLNIYNYPVRSLGDMFDKEVDLEDYIEKHKLYKDFQIVRVERQASPNGTKDRFDFLGFDKKDNEVVLELKHQGGGKRAVEQVMRYSGILKQSKDIKIRKVLVTGVVELSISEAIFGMSALEKKYFEWYVYNWDKAKDTLKFERITNKYIDEEITKMRGLNL